MKKEIRQNIADMLTNQGRHDIIKRFKESEYPPVLTFMTDGEPTHYKVESIKKGIWVRKVRLYKPEEITVTDV